MKIVIKKLNYKGWTISESESDYGFTVRNPQGYLSLETSKHGTLKDCYDYIDNAIAWKPTA